MNHIQGWSNRYTQQYPHVTDAPGAASERNAFRNEQPYNPPNQPDVDKAPSTIQAITQFGTASIPNVTESNIYVLSIIGQVEGHMILPPQNKTTKYEHIIPQLIAAEQNPRIEGVLVILNTVGGDVEAGLAIAEMIASLSKPTVTLVLGGGHSIGGPIAVSSQVSIIAETATMTIHPIRLTGLVIGVPQTFEYLDKMQERVVRFVIKHSRITEETFKSLMFKTGELTRDIGTTVIGPEAVRVGLIDEVGGLGTALNHLNRMIDHRRSAGFVPPPPLPPAPQQVISMQPNIPMPGVPLHPNNGGA